MSIDEPYVVPAEKSKGIRAHRHGLRLQQVYRCIIDRKPPVVTTPPMAASDPAPYYLYPQDSQSSSLTSPEAYSDLQLCSPDTHLPGPPCTFAKSETDKTSESGFEKKLQDSCDNVAENMSISPKLALTVPQVEEFKTHDQQEMRFTQEEYAEKQQMSTSAFSTPKVLTSNKSATPLGNIVERNKLTLGRNASKSKFSYVKVHALKHTTPHNKNKETADTKNRDDFSDPKVVRINKGKKAQHKGNPSRPQKEMLAASEVTADWRECLSSPLARPVAVAQPKLHEATLSQPLTPSFCLNTSLQLLPLIEQTGQNTVVNVAPLCDCPQWSFTSKVDLAFERRCHQTKLAEYSQMSWKGLKPATHNQALESSAEQWQRTTALEWPLSCEDEEPKWNPIEIHKKQLSQNFSRTPTTASSVGLSSFTVLPPIEKPVAVTGNVDRGLPIHRSSSDGYLVQMEKQKQLRVGVTYKVYSLKDYKHMKSDISLQGLGPDYKAIEKTAEKMKRQKLYSDVIRQQNKKISRIPFLPAKDPDSSEKKVPRMKALEYAKNIAKPPVQPRPKAGQKPHCHSECITGYIPYLEGLDQSQFATLELLRKRHEAEKRAVAVLRKVHAL
ncbi:uncharacterized protein V6R79_004421 [Siganus canaliculatus]